MSALEPRMRARITIQGPDRYVRATDPSTGEVREGSLANILKGITGPWCGLNWTLVELFLMPDEMPTLQKCAVCGHRFDTLSVERDRAVQVPSPVDHYEVGWVHQRCMDEPG